MSLGNGDRSALKSFQKLLGLKMAGRIVNYPKELRKCKNIDPQ
jgi:hypothetical protein